MTSRRAQQLYAARTMQTDWRSGQGIGNPRRAGMIQTNIPISSDISGIGYIGCGPVGPGGAYGAYGIAEETVAAGMQAAGAIASGIAGAVKPRDPVLAAGKATAKQQKKYQKMLKRAAKVKDPVKRDRLMKAAEAYGRSAAGGMPDSVLAAQEANVESQLDAEPESAETPVTTYLLAGGAALALVGGAAFLWQRSRR